MPSGFHDDYRFHTRGCTQAADKAAGVTYTLHVEQDGTRVRVNGEIIEHVTEVDVGGVAQRDHRGVTYTSRTRPIEDGAAERARLRYERELARPDRGTGKGGVQANARTHHAKAIGAQHSHAVFACDLNGLFLKPFALFPGFAKAD